MMNFLHQDWDYFRGKVNETVENLSGKQVTAAIRLSEGMLAKEVAKELGITPQTIAVWRMDPDFRALVNAIKLQRLHAGIAQLQGLVPKAISALSALLKCESEHVRLKAARLILEYTGFNQGKDGFALGIGSTDPDVLAEERTKFFEPRDIAAIMGIDMTKESDEIQ